MKKEDSITHNSCGQKKDLLLHENADKEANQIDNICLKCKTNNESKDRYCRLCGDILRKSSVAGTPVTPVSPASALSHFENIQGIKNEPPQSKQIKKFTQENLTTDKHNSNDNKNENTNKQTQKEPEKRQSVFFDQVDLTASKHNF